MESNENVAEQETETATVEDNNPADLGDAGKRALDAERKRANDAEKRLKDALARIQSFEDSQKSESEKLSAALERAKQGASEAEARTAKAERALLAVKAAVKAELPVDAAARLQGETFEELLADAKALRAQFAPAGPRKPAPVKEAGEPKGEVKDKKQLLADAINASFGS